MLIFRSFPKLKTDRLILRQLQEDDKEEIFFLRSDERVMQYIKRTGLKNLEEVSDFMYKINNDLKNNKILYWAISLKNNPKLIGTICLWNFSKNQKIAEIGYDLHPKYHGQGIMNEAMKHVLDFGFNTIGFEVIEAFTHKDNINSIKLLKKNNFILSMNKEDMGNLNNIIFTKTKI